MNDQDTTNSTASPPDGLNVLVAGGGVAGLEAVFALRELAGARVRITLLASAEDYVERAWSVGEPFSTSHAERFSLAKLAQQAGAELIRDTLIKVDAEGQTAHTTGGLEIGYDALLVSVGATTHQMFEHATTIDDAHMDEVLHGLVQDVEGGYVRRLAIVVPAPIPWPLPAYELALMASERAWETQADMDITLLTPERAPLEIFGAGASRALAELMAASRIEVVTSAYCEIPRAKMVIVHPSGRTIAADRVIALPQLRGPALDGLPQDGGGFIPVDEYGQVRGVEGVWAAGDATDTPIKQGGVGAQLADTAARAIAARAGAPLQAPPFAPVLEGVLMTGGRLRSLRHRSASGTTAEESVFSEMARGAGRPKIATRYLEPQLRPDSA
jgi:sulfide:quinone oxidoreductase